MGKNSKVITACNANDIFCGKVMRGRFFSPKEINLIQRIVTRKYATGRTSISLEICRLLDWTQPNGWPKDRACRDVLIYMEKEGYINLPPHKIKKTIKQHINSNVSYYQRLDDSPVLNLDFSSLKLVQVKGLRDERLWNWLVDKYHYLGFRLFVGRSLKYLVFSHDKIIGAIGWCDPAWSVSARDIILEKVGLDKITARNKGINNGRFLILPWITVPNLASHILSVAIKQILHDWIDYYSVRPLFLETFVDPSKFSGTCYKAANWIQLGLSKGFRKIGKHYTNSQTPKNYFIYPLDSLLRRGIINILGEVNNGSLVRVTH